MRLTPLNDRRVRTAALVAVAVPTLGLYLYRGLVEPLTSGRVLDDFTNSYLVAAARLLSGHTPYEPQRVNEAVVPSGTFYVQPPLMAWLLQPLVHLGTRLSTDIWVLFLNLCLVAFLLVSWRALAIRDWQLRLLTVLVVTSFRPVLSNIFEGQVNLVLLALSAFWLWAYVEGDRWWGGAAIGFSIVLKLMHAPCALLLAWGRRWRMMAAAAVTGLLALLLPAPWYLPQYLFGILPRLQAGTGFWGNHSPGGTLIRLFEPATFEARSSSTGPPLVHVLAYALAIGVVGLSWWVLREPGRGRWRRALEASVAVSISPLVASYSWGTHLVILLLPMITLLAWAIVRRDWLKVGLVFAVWLLLSPLEAVMDSQVLVQTNLLLLRLLAEHGVVGIFILWTACLYAAWHEEARDGTEAVGRRPDPARLVGGPGLEPG